MRELFRKFVGRDLCAVLRERELRVRPQICSDLFGLHLLDIGLVGLQGGIIGFKFGLDLIAGEALLSLNARTRGKKRAVCSPPGLRIPPVRLTDQKWVIAR